MPQGAGALERGMIMERMEDGMPVYSVETADRAVSIEGQVVLKFTGGEDGPIGILMPEEGRVQTALLLLRGQPALSAVGVATTGTSMGRDAMGRFVLILHFEGDARLNLVLSKEQEDQFFQAKRPPQVAAPRAN